MKKEYIVGFIITLMSLLLFNIKLNALTCKYENPYDSSKEIVLEYTRNNYDTKNGYSTCIDTSKSTFKELNIYTTSGGSIKYETYDNKKWIFSEDAFSYGSCIQSLSRGSEDETESCPSLGVYEVKNGKDIYYEVMENSPYVLNVCYQGVCKALVQKEGNPSQTVNVNDSGSVITEEIKEIKSCTYDIDVSHLSGNGVGGSQKSVFTIKEYDNGVLKGTLDGSQVTFNFSSDYFMNAWSQLQMANFRIKKENAPSILALSNSDEGTGLTCRSSDLWIYYENGSYYIVASRSDIPTDNKDYTNFGQHGVEGDYGKSYNLNQTIADYDYSSDTCKNMLGDKLIEILQGVWDVIKVVAIIILIVFSMIDFAKHAGQDKADVLKAVKKWVTRLIVLIIILLLPTIIQMIGDIVGFEDILCGIK